MSEKVKVAGVQMKPKIMKKEENLEKILCQTKGAADNGGELVIFPECALTGYMYASREEAMPSMETIPGPSTDKVTAYCRELNVHVIFGLLETDAGKCFNAVALVGPQGLIGKYRKTHLPFLGVDRFLDLGDNPFQVHDTPVGKIGLHICYDGSFPETPRVLTLLGAEILALPTNWPREVEVIPKYQINTRARENRVFYVAVNRVGRERGAVFMGHSKMADTWGNTLAEACHENEEIIYAEIDPAEARQKRRVLYPGEHEADLIGDRRPELYGEITRAR